jgi:hypothetical protein
MADPKAPSTPPKAGDIALMSPTAIASPSDPRSQVGLPTSPGASHRGQSSASLRPPSIVSYIPLCVIVMLLLTVINAQAPIRELEENEPQTTSPLLHEGLQLVSEPLEVDSTTNLVATEDARRRLEDARTALIEAEQQFAESQRLTLEAEQARVMQAIADTQRAAGDAGEAFHVGLQQLVGDAQQHLDSTYRSATEAQGAALAQSRRATAELDRILEGTQRGIANEAQLQATQAWEAAAEVQRTAQRRYSGTRQVITDTGAELTSYAHDRVRDAQHAIGGFFDNMRRHAEDTTQRITTAARVADDEAHRILTQRAVRRDSANGAPTYPPEVHARPISAVLSPAIPSGPTLAALAPAAPSPERPRDPYRRRSSYRNEPRPPDPYHRFSTQHRRDDEEPASPAVRPRTASENGHSPEYGMRRAPARATTDDTINAIAAGSSLIGIEKAVSILVAFRIGLPMTRKTANHNC